MRRSILWIISVATLFLAATPAGAISNGVLDGNAHPAVACIVALDLDGNQWGCVTGQLISPTVVLTAAHVVAGVSTFQHVWVSFDTDFHLATSKLYPVTGMA